MYRCMDIQTQCHDIDRDIHTIYIAIYPHGTAIKCTTMLPQRYAQHLRTYLTRYEFKRESLGMRLRESPQHTATHHNTLQHTHTPLDMRERESPCRSSLCICVYAYTYSCVGESTYIRTSIDIQMYGFTDV